MKNLILDKQWKEALKAEFSKPYFKDLVNFLEIESKNHLIYPPRDKIFNAINTCGISDVKVVILGQDPYHGENQANGLSFSVNNDVKIPPSLRNIFKELKNQYDIDPPKSGDLEYLAKQGVLLLNATLTVRSNEAGSHQKKGWEEFTDAIIHHLNSSCNHLVFILWGAYAQKKASFIDSKKHLILKSVHPSPLSASRGFFHNKHFIKTNEYLNKHNFTEIKWI